MIEITSLLAVTPPPADQTTTYIIMGGASLFIVYAFMRMNKRKAKRDPMDTPFQTRSLAQQRSTERQFETLLVEFSEMSRKMTAQLDTRAAKLEALIGDADERIARLEALNQQAPPRPNFAMPTEKPADKYTPSATPTPDPGRHRQSRRRRPQSAHRPRPRRGVSAGRRGSTSPRHRHHAGPAERGSGTHPGTPPARVKV